MLFVRALAGGQRRRVPQLRDLELLMRASWSKDQRARAKRDKVPLFLIALDTRPEDPAGGCHFSIAGPLYSRAWRSRIERLLKWMQRN